MIALKITPKSLFCDTSKFDEGPQKIIINMNQKGCTQEQSFLKLFEGNAIEL